MTRMTVRQWRRSLDLSQVEFAKMIGMSPYTYQAKESGHRPFKANEIKIIAQVLNISIDSQLEW